MALKTLMRRVLRFWIVRIAVALLFVFAALLVRDVVLGVLRQALALRGRAPKIWLGPVGPPAASPPAILYTVLAMAVTVSLGHFAYLLYARLLERRAVSEFAGGPALRELAVGFAIGAGFVIFVMSILWGLGFYRVRGVNHWTAIVPMFVAAVTAGYMEELIARGILFRILEERLGSWITLLATAILFGTVHLGNENATVVSSLAIALSGAVVLGALFLVSRRLWLPIGAHTAVNFMQGGIFGVAVSGEERPGLLDGALRGPALLTGGTFGPEASLLVVLAALGVGALVIRKVYEKHGLIRPLWRRRGNAHAAVG